MHEGSLHRLQALTGHFYFGQLGHVSLCENELVKRSRSPFARTAVVAVLTWAAAATHAQSDEPKTAATSEPPHRSALDAPLFYQLLIGEMQLRSGQPGVAYGVILDAARRTKDEALFQRAMDIALQARAGDEALAATRAWRAALPQSSAALRAQLQILVALNRVAEAAEPLGVLLSVSDVQRQQSVIRSLPSFLQGTADPRAAAEMAQKVLREAVRSPATRVVALSALGRLWWAAGDAPQALALAREGAREAPTSPDPALLALAMLPRHTPAESVVRDHMASASPDPGVRFAYGRVLAQSQRLTEARLQLETVTQQRPQWSSAWMTLGAVLLELRQPEAAERALQAYLRLLPSAGSAPSAQQSPPADDDEGSDGTSPDQNARLQAWLLLAQAAEMRNDLAAAEAYLAKVDSPSRALEVQTRRATWMAKQGRVEEARALIRRVPTRGETDARALLAAEGQVLREAKRWKEAYEVASEAARKFPQDAELLYEQAMMAEKTNQLELMEQLLRQVIALKPDHQHAYNALGYSLADRGLRLQEARELIGKALELAPGDPFITDSLGWVEYRLGNLAAALKLLQQAYDARPDTEIAAHLGEVLWVSGQRDAARRIFREGRSRDAGNEVLQETVARLKADL